MRNSPATAGAISSEKELFEALEMALKTYKTEDQEVALKRVGKGLCPKSFPITLQSLYFLRLFNLTHGGDTKTDMLHLPNDGGVLEQPNIFFQASDIIRNIKIAAHNKEIREQDERLDKVRGESGSGESDSRPRSIAAGR